MKIDYEVGNKNMGEQKSKISSVVGMTANGLAEGQDVVVLGEARNREKEKE